MKHKLMFNANEGEEGKKKEVGWETGQGMNECWRATPHRGQDYSVT